MVQYKSSLFKLNEVTGSLEFIATDATNILHAQLQEQNGTYVLIDTIVVSEVQPPE